MEASLSLPEEWFTDPGLTTNGNVSVDIRFNNSFESPKSIGIATLIRRPRIQFTTKDVIAILPVGIAFHNDLLMVPVQADVVYSVATFSMLCNVSDGLVLENNSIIIGSKWNYEIRQQLSTDISIVAMLADPSDVTDNPVTPELPELPEVLFTFGIRVTQSAPPSQRQHFSCTVMYISHVLNEKVQLRNMTTPQPATIIDYFDGNPFLGEVQIEQSRPVAIFPYTQQSHLINTAYLTGIEVSVPVQVLAIYESGSIRFSTPDNCTSLTDSVSLSTQCNRVILTGNETHGDESAAVFLQYRGLETNVTFRVWFPESPIQLVSTPANLSAVEGWMDQDLSTNSCVQQYQRGKLSALANFTYSESSPRYEVNIFSLIQTQVVSSNNSVVSISDDGMLVGLQPGECQISAGSNILPLSVHVLVSSVQVESLNALLTTGVSLNLPSDAYEVLSTVTVSAFLLQDFNIDGAKISVIPGVVFSDGTQYLLTDDVIISSLNQTVLSVEGSTDVTVLGSGIAVVQVSWFPECSPSSLASTNVTVTVDLPDPSHIQISLNTTRITPFNGLARHAGVATKASLQAFLVYPDDTRIDFSTDRRLQLDLTQANDLITTSVSNDAVIIMSSGGVGIATVIVSVTGHTVTTQFNISVVDYSYLFMYGTPYPPYNGSDTIRVNQLHQIANTGIYQQALLQMLMILTDNSTTEITVLSFYESKNVSVSISGNRVTGRLPGRATITGFFGNLSTIIELAVTDTPVVITQFIEFTLGTDTLSGTKDTHRVQLQVSAMFNDSTIHNELLSNNRALYPGLLGFTSSVPSSALVSEFTGVVTLRDNYHGFVTITVQTALSTAMETFTFACNLVAAEVGDIDLGYQTGIPVPPQIIGNSFNLPIYVNTGGQRLRTFDLSMFIDLSILEFQLVTPGTDFVPTFSTTQDSNTLTIMGMGVCGSVCDTQQLIHIADLNFTAVNASLVEISGMIVSLTSDGGNPISSSSRSFIAGELSISIIEEGMRRRRTTFNSNPNLHRNRRQTDCQTLSNCNCPLAGDLNEDCILDVSDAQFLLTYLAEETYNFQLSSLNLTSSQISELDIDKNGVVDLSDAYVLERVSLNLLHLLTNVTISPVQLSMDCTLMVSASFLSRDSTNNSLLVFFDFSVPFDRNFTTQQFDDSIFEQGQHITSGKSRALQGGVVMGEYVNPGQYITRIRTDLILSNITLNVLQVNENTERQSSLSPSRVQPMFGFPDPPFEYPLSFEYDLPFSSGIVNIPVTNGFNPFMTFDNLLSTAACMNRSAPPVFDSVNYNASVNENQETGTHVVTVVATTETFYSIQYAIVSGNDLQYFSIDRVTGNITTNSSLDAESSVTEFILTVTASLQGTQPAISSNSSVLIRVTNINEAPVISPIGDVRINVTTPVNSTIVELMVTDPDTSDATFSTLVITDTAPPTSVFAIVGSSVVVNEPLATGPTVNYTLNVTVTDVLNSSLISMIAFTITVVNISPPLFDMQVYSTNISESTEVGTNLTTLTITAPLGSAIVYSIQNFSSQFGIDERSNQLILLQNFSFEEQNYYRFEIEATVTISGENYPANTTIEVTVYPDIDNETVEFTMDTYNADIPEGSDNGTFVLQVMATVGNGSSTMIAYSIVNSSSVPFNINETTGEIMVEGVLDYESVQSYSFLVMAIGPDSTIDIASVIINITNINDNLPSIRLSVNSYILRLNTPQDSIIATVESSDADGVEGLQYTLMDNLIATINGTTGVITSNSLTESLAGRVYTLVVVVTDGKFNDTTSLSVLLLNPTYSLMIPESQFINQSILMLADRIIDNIVYSSSQLSEEFVLNATTGTLYQIGTLVNLSYQLIINVTSPTQVEQVTVNITVIRNNTAPTFSSGIYQTSLPVNAPIGTTVIQVNASDVDLDDQLTYSIQSNYSFIISIDPLTGIVTTTQCLPSSIEGSVLTISVMVTDGELNATALLNINITPSVNNTACNTFNFTSEVDIEYSINGGGFLVNTDQRLTRLTYSQLFSFLTEQTGTLTATVGNKQDSITYQPQRLMAETVTAILLNDVVYYDNAMIRVALQVRDVRYSSNVLSTTVQIQVTHPNNEAINEFCTVNSQTGSCIAQASLPDHWFSTAANISVEYSIVGNSNTMQYLGLVQVTPRVNYTVNYTVTLIAPARPLYRGEQFMIPIVAHAGFAVRSYQLVMTIPTGFMIDDIMVDTSRWSLDESSVSNQDGSVTISFLATLLLSVAETVTTDMITGPTDLAEVRLTIQNNAVENTEYRINCAVIELANIFENVLVNDAPPVALWVTRHGTEMQTGTLYVASDSVMGLFAYSSQSELVYLNNAMQYDVRLLTARAMRGLRDITTTSCTSSNEGIVNVTSDCRSVFLTATQTEPQYLVNITLSSNGYEVILPFKIWFPLNYSLLVSDNMLSPINGSFNPAENCAPVYQQSRVRVECVFTDGERSSEAVDITRHITSNLQVQNTSVAMYQNGYVTGITPGVTMLVLQNNGQILASSNIMVVSDPVDIMLLDITVVASVLLTSPSSSVPPYETHFIQVSLQDVLEYEGAEAYIAVTALLSDSTRFPLNNVPGLLISSLNTDVVVTGSTPSVVQAGRNSGSKELLEVNVTSQNCSSVASVYSQTAFINVSLPRPISVSITPSTAQLTKPLDAATLIGIHTEVILRVEVTLESGRTQDMTGDDRTMYNLSSGLNITLDGNTARIRANQDSTSGDHIITVSFSHVNLSANASIQIVQALDIELEAHPFPRYPNSNQYETTVLYSIANTGLWEQAVVSATLLLSDSTQRDISTNTHLTLSFSSQSSSVIADIVTITLNQVLNTTSVSAAGFVEIMGTFGNVNSSRSLRVNVSTVPVMVNSIDNVYLLSGRTYVTGVRDIGSDQVIVSVTLNDTTRYVDLFRSGVRELPQLLQFATNNSSVLSVNESTGSLTLHANSRILQTITVTARFSGESNSNLQVACNLEPAIGDVDLGSQTGLPLNPLTVGSTVDIPVHINAGSVGVASLDIDVMYPATILRAQNVTLSSLTSTNPFIGSTNDPPGVVALGGTLDQNTARRIILIATLHFEVIGQADNTVEFTGNINQFHNIDGALIGEGGSFVAGNIEADIVSSKRRRTIRNSIPAPPVVMPRRRNRRATPCDDPPCSSCPDNRDVGDTNFDCILNVQDVTFTRVYITEAPLGFTGSLAYLLQDVTDDQRTVLDSDHNGVINIDDAFYLLRVVFGLIRFVGNHTIISEPPDCRLQINFILYSEGRTVTDGSDASKTTLGVLVANTNASFQQAFDNDALTDGQRLSLSTSSGLIGGVVMANFTGNGVYTVIFSRDIAQYDNIGISLVQLTTDDFGMTNLARQIFLRGRPLSPYAYPGRLDVEVDTFDIPLLASSGYNPLLLVNSLGECIVSTSVTPTPTTTLISSSSITSIVTTTATILTSSVTPGNTTTIISSSLTTTSLTTMVSLSSVSTVTISTTLASVSSSSPIVGTSSAVLPSTTSSSSASLVSTITSNSSLFLTPSSTTAFSASSVSTSSIVITPSPTITLSLTTATSSVMTSASSTTVQVDSSTLTLSIGETSSSGVLTSTTTIQTVSTMIPTTTPIVTPSVSVEFPSITPSVVVQGMDMKLLDQVMGNVSSGFTQGYGLLVAQSQDVMASLAGYQSQATVQEDRKPATRFKASVLHQDDRVWRDGNIVSVVFQVHDDDWNTRVLSDTMIDMLVTLENDGSTMMYNCRPDENSGVCMINVIFPSEWFDVSSIQQARLAYSILDPTLIATLSLQPYVTVSSSLNQVVVELPSRSIYSGQIFTATVYAYTSFSVNGFTLIFETSSNINILSVSIDSSVWSYNDASSNQQYSIAAFSNDPEGSPLNINRTLLLTLNLQASQQSSNSFINGTVESLTTTRGAVVLNNQNSTSGPIIMWTRNIPSTIGIVDIVEERPLALFAVTTTSQIVNTFVLNGVSKTAGISLLAGYSTGQLREVTNGLTCTSNNVSVISIDSQCSTVSAGNQGAAYANVTITHMNVFVDVTFKIWFPQNPMQILLSDSILNQVENGNCNMYQKATINVLTNFVSGDNTVHRVVVTDYVSSSIISMQPSIANVSSIVVTGVVPGETSICVERNGITWGCTNVSVSSELTTVYDLAAIFVNNITILEDPQVNRLSISVEYLLEIDGDRAGVAAAVRYIDGTIFVLDDAEISLQSLNTALLETEGANIISRNTGEAQLNITWLPPGCTTAVHSLFNISLSLQSPTSIMVTSPSSRSVEITPSSDAARHVGVRTVQEITVELLYNNGRTQVVTTDNRTSYMTDIDILVVNRSINGVSVTVNDGVAVSGVLRVSYMPLTPLVIFFTIVRAERLVISAHHYPPYSGSYSDSITMLRLISGTGVRQMAALRLILELSNNDNMIVTTNILTTFRRVSSTSPTLLGNITISQVNDDIVLRISSSEVGNIVIEGMFTTSIANVTKTIELTSLQTFVTSLTVNALPAGTLRGQYGANSAPLTVNVLFDDGSRISDLVPSGLPGLLNFTAVDGAVFTVNEFGVLSPLANTHAPVTVLVNTITEDISVPYQFFVNLEPSEGDIDLGSLNGAPITVSSTSPLQVPVYVNTGGRDLGAVQVNVQFDPALLQATDVSEGTGWQRGISDYNIDNVVGLVDFGGAIMATGVSGTRIHIFTLNFVVTRPLASSVVTNLIATIDTITELSIDTNNIGEATPRFSRAGNVSFIISPVASKRSIHNRKATVNRVIPHKVSKKQVVPCIGNGCPASAPGDTNGDGMFDIRDVSYALIYIVEASLGFSSERGTQINSSITILQQTSLDADLNTIVDIADAVFLLKAVFRLVYLIQDPMINLANLSTNCLVEISATLTTGTSIPVDDVVVYFDIGLLDIDAHSNFTESPLLDGTVVTYDKGDGHFGGIIMAQRISTSQFVVRINSSLVDNVIGVSILQVTFDALNMSRTSRTAQLFGAMTFPLTYPYPLDYTINIRGYNFTVFTSHGYNPLISSEIGTDICIITGPNISTAAIVSITEVTLSDREYAVIAVSLILFVLGILLLLIAIRCTCQAKREKQDSGMMANDFTQEDYYVVRYRVIFTL